MSEVDASESGSDDESTLREREEELLERIEAYFGAHRDDLERRHWIQALATLGLVGAGAKEMYRREWLQALPDLRYHSSGDEDQWEMSWHPSREQVPEALSGASGFAALVALASIGGERRAEAQPFLSVATAGLSLFQAIGSTNRLVDELQRGEVDALSSIETILSASTVPLVLPEAVRAVRRLFED